MFNFHVLNLKKKTAYILQIQIPTEIPSHPPRRRSAPTVF
jgi:hypothetical protein